MKRTGFRDLFSSSLAVGLALGLLNYPVSFVFDLLLGHSHRRDLFNSVAAGILGTLLFVGNRRLLK